MDNNLSFLSSDSDTEDESMESDDTDVCSRTSSPAFVEENLYPANYVEKQSSKPRVRRASKLGRRKLRRFENDFYFFANEQDCTARNPTLAFLLSSERAMAAATYYCSEDKENDEGVFNLLKKQRPELFDDFVEGDDCGATPTTTLGNELQHRRVSHKKKKNVAIGSIPKSLARFGGFVREVEQMLLDEAAVVPNQNEQKEVENPTVMVKLLVESAFHRMLAHKVARFYRIPSWTSASTKLVHFIVDVSKLVVAPNQLLSSRLLQM